MKASRGFTLIEMVMVILIIAILSVVASAKSGFFSGWKEAGTAQLVAGSIGVAQELAIANRRTVYIVFTPTAMSACYDAACSSPCRSLDGSAMVLTAPSGVFQYTAGSFSFDPQGRPSFSGVFSIVYNGQTTSIQPETGVI